MPSVCQSRLSEVHIEQSTWNGKSLSMMTASRLAASRLTVSCYLLVLGFRSSVHVSNTNYSSASGIQLFLQLSDCFCCCMHCNAGMNPDHSKSCMSAAATEMVSVLNECKHATPKSS